jgi:hypothetical protein
MAIVKKVPLWGERSQTCSIIDIYSSDQLNKNTFTVNILVPPDYELQTQLFAMLSIYCVQSDDYFGESSQYHSTQGK